MVLISISCSCATLQTSSSLKGNQNDMTCHNAANSLTDESSCHKNEIVLVMHLLIFPELEKQQDCERKIWK